MPVQMSFSGFNFDIAQGILYAAGLPATGANGALVQAPSRAQIINVSLGGPSPSTTLRNAVNAANAARRPTRRWSGS